MPKSLKIIGDFVFEGCSSLTKIVIPKNVTYIGGYPFATLTKEKFELFVPWKSKDEMPKDIGDPYCWFSPGASNYVIVYAK